MDEVEIGELGLGEGVDVLPEVGADKKTQVTQAKGLLSFVRNACDEIAVTCDVEWSEIESVTKLIVIVGMGHRSDKRAKRGEKRDQWQQKAMPERTSTAENETLPRKKWSAA